MGGQLTVTTSAEIPQEDSFPCYQWDFFGPLVIPLLIPFLLVLAPCLNLVVTSAELVVVMLDPSIQVHTWPQGLYTSDHLNRKTGMPASQHEEGGEARAAVLSVIIGLEQHGQVFRPSPLLVFP